MRTQPFIQSMRKPTGALALLALLSLAPVAGAVATAAPSAKAQSPSPQEDDAKDSTIATWPAEKQAAYAGWPPETQDYYWTLTSPRQKLFWGLADSDKITLSTMSAEDQATAWERIEARSGSDPSG